jgi:NAD(P)-dependent dehydrogenase (short-subunit alcohol dehydrogenase family)
VTNLENQTILIAGCNGRIGHELVNRLIFRGANVIGLDLGFSNFNSDNFEYIEVDLLNQHKVESIFDSFMSRTKIIDSVVHVAWPQKVNWRQPFEIIDINTTSSILSEQLGSVIIFSKIVSNFFRLQGHGNLVLTSSIQGVAAPKFHHYIGTDMSSPLEYTAVKTALVGIVRWLAKYHAGMSIRVNAVSPGGIRENQPRSFLDAYRADSLNKGMLDAADLLGTYEFLLSSASEFLNGQNIVVDDGWSL